MIDLMQPLPDDWNDAEFDAARRRLTENPKALSDADLAQFLVAFGGAFAEVAATARRTGLPPGQENGPKAGDGKPATVGHVSAAVDVVLNLFRTLRVGRRLLALEEKVRALDAAGLPHCEGIHENSKHYRQGSLVTRSGSLWLALNATSDTPGAGATAWKLIVKGS